MAIEQNGNLITAVGSLGSAGLSQLFNSINMGKQTDAAKDLMDYQWRNFLSPRAQAKAYADAGISPQALVDGKGSTASPSVNMPSSAPVSVDGVLDLSSLSNYIQSVANAKKAGMDTKLAEQEIKNKQIDADAKQFETELLKEFGRGLKTAELTKAYKELLLADDAHDINVQEKALNVWRQVSEKALADTRESERDIARQRLENNPTAIRLENQLMEEKSKTEKAHQGALAASAEESRTAASVNRENRRLQSALADIEEEGKDVKISALISEYLSKGWISDADAEEARLRADRIRDARAHRDNSVLFKEIDSLTEWFKNKAKIFSK